MSDDLSIEQKIAVAETVSTGVDAEELDVFCKDRGLVLGDVAAWSTAYETGGALGVQALIVSWLPDRAQARAWHELAKSQVKRFRPRQLRVRVEGNAITAEEVKPLTATNVIYAPVFQLRAVVDQGIEHWFLYWRRADGTFWPYAGHAGFVSIEAAVDEVARDPHHCFRLHPPR